MITLVRMNAEQYKRFFEETVREYGEENVRGGRWTPSESIGRAIKETNELLSKGIHTNGHFLCSANNENAVTPSSRGQDLLNRLGTQEFDTTIL